MYVAFQDDKKSNTDFNCFCGKVAIKKQKKGRRYSLCDKHEFQVSMILMFRDVDFKKVFNTWQAIEYAKEDLKTLPNKYRQSLESAERSLPKEQKTW